MNCMSRKVTSIALSTMLALGSIAVNTPVALANVESNLDPNRMYRASYSSLTEAEDAAAALNIRLAGEGAVLLKNMNNTLPLAVGKVTVLGSQADTLATGGSGSGGQTKPAGDNTPDVPVTLFESLEAAGFEANPSVKAAYEKEENAPKTLTYSGNPYDGGHYMVKVDAQTDAAVAFDGGWYEAITDGTGSLEGVTLEGYNDTALLVFSRSGAESQDNDAWNLTDKETGEAVTDNVNDHYLQLTTSEKELVAYAKQNFDKVVVLVNCPSAMELGCLENDEEIDAVLWIGQPGWNGIMAVGQILNGTVNPSGHTVDVFAADFTTDPTWYNFGDFSQVTGMLTGEGEQTKAAPRMGYDEAYAVDGVTNGNYPVIDYAEGIYLGYRYYETVYADMAAIDEDVANAWYQRAVVYPFGYGLSYTQFTQEITSVEGDLNNADGYVTVNVKVTNTGAVAGKDVVELYSTAPYAEDEIEKPAVALVAFEKTNELQAGESQDVALTVAVKDLASFDYNDANANDNYGYELEAGTYVLSIRADSHTVLDSAELTADETLTWDEDGNEETPNNIFSAEADDEVWAAYNTQANAWTVAQEDHYLRRSQLVLNEDEGPVVALEAAYEVGELNELQEQLAWLMVDDGENNLFSAEAFNLLNNQEVYAVSAVSDHDNAATLEVETDVANPWVVDEVPAEWTQNAAELNELGMYPIELADMVGLPLTDAKWVDFMNQLTWDELTLIANDGGYGSAAIKTIGKPEIKDHDGPGQLRANWSTVPDGNGYAWACESVIGSTWNKELAYEQGTLVANEGMLLGVAGWYGPGMNIHRSPLSGRNFEYYSQDGVQGGYILASVVKGATDNGMHVYMKHAFLNDQETSRTGIATFATEQAIREIYAKPFEIATKQGNANGMMTSFNRIGLSTSAAYAITVQMYENEWGFDGISVTDAFYNGSGWTPENLVRGHLMPLNSKFLAFPPLQRAEGVWDETLRDGKGGILVMNGEEQVESVSEYKAVRDTATRALYAYANSNTMTGLKTAMLLKNRAVAVKASTAYEALAAYTAEEMAAFTADMNTVFGENNWTVTVEGGAEGVTFDPAAGTLTGITPATAGAYAYTITVRGKGNMSGVTGVSTLSMSVAAEVDAANVNASFVGLVELVEGENFVKDGDPTQRENEGKYTSCVYTAANLPEGLTIDAETGVISGAIAGAQSGEQYEVTINQTVVLCEDGFIGWFFAGRTLENTITVYLNIQ